MTSSIKSFAAAPRRRRRRLSPPFIRSDKQSHISIDKSRVMTVSHALLLNIWLKNHKCFLKCVAHKSSRYLLILRWAPHLKSPWE